MAQIKHGTPPPSVAPVLPKSAAGKNQGSPPGRQVVPLKVARSVVEAARRGITTPAAPAPTSPPPAQRKAPPTAPGTTTAGAQLAEMKKTVLTLRQARDSVIEQCAAVSDKLLHAEDRIGELEEEQQLLLFEKKECLELLSLVQ